MSMPRAICCLVLLLAVGRGALFAQAQTSDQGRSLGDVARELRSKKAATPATETETSSQPSISAKLPGAIVTDSPDVERFTEDIRTRVLRNDFAGLDEIADAVRASKTRFPGGGWKLTRFYEALNSRPAGSYTTDADWQSHLAFYQRWMKARPKSIYCAGWTCRRLRCLCLGSAGERICWFGYGRRLAVVWRADEAG